MRDKLILAEEVNAGEISEDTLQIQSPLITQDLKVSATKILVIQHIWTAVTVKWNRTMQAVTVLFLISVLELILNMNVYEVLPLLFWLDYYKQTSCLPRTPRSSPPASCTLSGGNHPSTCWSCPVSPCEPGSPSSQLLLAAPTQSLLHLQVGNNEWKSTSEQTHSDNISYATCTRFLNIVTNMLAA